MSLPSQIIRKTSTFAAKIQAERINATSEDERTKDRIAALGPVERLRTINKNSSVPQGMKDDINELLFEIESARKFRKAFNDQSEVLRDCLDFMLAQCNPGEETDIARDRLSDFDSLLAVK